MPKILTGNRARFVVFWPLEDAASIADLAPVAALVAATAVVAVEGDVHTHAVAQLLVLCTSRQKG